MLIHENAKKRKKINASHVSTVATTVEKAVFVTFMLLIFLTGALTNAVVIISIFTNQKLKNDHQLHRFQFGHVGLLCRHSCYSTAITGRVK